VCCFSGREPELVGHPVVEPELLVRRRLRRKTPPTFAHASVGICTETHFVDVAPASLKQLGVLESIISEVIVTQSRVSEKIGKKSDITVECWVRWSRGILAAYLEVID
jgi:hypothetical protein